MIHDYHELIDEFMHDFMMNSWYVHDWSGVNMTPSCYFIDDFMHELSK